MDETQLDDLKQFITATVGQAEARITTELRADFRSEIGGLREEMREGFASIGDTMSHQNDQLDDHETRLTKLESKPA